MQPHGAEVSPPYGQVDSRVDFLADIDASVYQRNLGRLYLVCIRAGSVNGKHVQYVCAYSETTNGLYCGVYVSQYII